MRRIIVSILTLLGVLLLLGYSSGVLTGELRREDGCLLCRAERYYGRHYGIGYERIEDGLMTTWYRQNIDPRHGLDPQHPHLWAQSACTTDTHPFFGGVEPICSAVEPIFMLRPEFELSILGQISDKTVQVALIRSLISPDWKVNTHRVHLLIDYYYIERNHILWKNWWRLHAADFGLPPSP